VMQKNHCGHLGV